MMKRILLLFLPILLYPCLSNADTLQLVSGEFEPFSGEKLHGGGISTEIIRHTLSEMGHDVEFSYLPWKRGFSETLNKNYFATYPYSKNKERLKVWLFSAPLYDLTEHFFIKRGRPIHYEKNADINGLSICKPIGYNLFGLKELHDKGAISLERPVDLKACFLMLNLGRADIVMTNKVTASRMFEQLQLDSTQFEQLSKPFKEISHYLIIPKTQKNAETFITHFNRALKKLQDLGLFDAGTSK